MEIFLTIVALVWLIGATISDIKTKEIPNWLNFSLMLIAIMSYSIISLQNNSITPILYSLITLAAFFIIGSAMYYSRQWGGGDTKLLAAIGATFPTYPTALYKIFSPKLGTSIFPAAPLFPLIILLNIIIFGAVYGIIMLIIKILTNREKFSKEFKIIYKQYKIITYILVLLSITAAIISYVLIKTNEIKTLAIASSLVIPVIFHIFLIVKAAEKSSMYRKISTDKLREGDWVSEKIVINEKLIYEPKSTGINKEQLKIIKEGLKEVEIKEGIIFMPTFLIAVAVSLILGNPILWLF